MDYQHILITGGAGFVGSAIALGLKQRYPEYQITALDNLRRRGSELNLPRFRAAGINFIHGDIRNPEDLDPQALKPDLIVECSAEPSVLAGYNSPGYVLQTNLVGTINCLELARQTQADFLFLSTSRVYPIEPLTHLQYTETATRFQLDAQEINGASPEGIAEDFPLDGARSLYRCAMTGTPYTIFGYKGKQVRDAIHSKDLIRAFHAVFKAPRIAETYNIGGGRFSNASVLEAIYKSQEIVGEKMDYSYSDRNRIGDHIWWIGDNRKFASHYPEWKMEYNVDDILQQIYEINCDRWTRQEIHS